MIYHKADFIEEDNETATKLFDNFAAFYLENKKREKSIKRREEIVARQKEEEAERTRIDEEEKLKFLESSFDE